MDQDNVCSECNFKFTKKKNLYAHVRNIHKHDPLQLCRKTNNRPSELCEVCGKMFANKTSLHNHLKIIHNCPVSEKEPRKSRLICPYQECSEQLRCYDGLRKHLALIHKNIVELEELEFETELGFQQWKDSIQEKSLSQYSLDTSSKMLVDKCKKKYYNCHRSYSYVPKGNNIRSFKSAGTNKIGRACPSRLEVSIKKESGPVIVKFWKTHIGHEIDIGRIFLSQYTRAQIAGRFTITTLEKLKLHVTGNLQQGVSFNHILDIIRDSDVNHVDYNRLHLLEKKDMHNIVRDFNITYKTRHHQDDAISIKLWVEEMKNLGNDCPVLYYKEQGVETNSEVLDINDFLLIIMTSFQAQQLLEFGNDKICIDGTHGTNSYDFHLYTVMTVDEFGSGCPVAFCFSNRADEIVFNIFFGQIKLKVGIIEAKVFMSDDAPAFYNAWVSIMTPVPNRLLCAWHVDRNWRQNLSKISGSSEKKALVYKTLRVLLQSTSTQDFSINLNQVLQNLYTDSDTTSFAKYFENTYAHRSETWAYCYHIGLGINTNMYLESLHKVLKHIYLEGKKVKRLDKSVDAVIKIARDSLFKRVIKLAKGSSTTKIKKIQLSHKSSFEISSNMITPLEDENEWLVTSFSSEQYMVVKLNEECSTPCLRCAECNICVHSFKCSCIDNVIKLNICKHIHACARLFVKTQNCSVVALRTNATDIFETNIPLRAQPSENDVIKKRAELVIGLCSTSSVTEEDHKSIINHFDKIINIMNKTKTIQLHVSNNIDTNQNVTRQKRLFSTKKKIQKVTEFKKPTLVETKNILEGLLSKSDNVLNIHSRFDHTYT